ncbi:Chaperone required for the assembly of the F1-ATPase [Yoonia rosea]|uniref:Chaperone required for the assembly of the F1-ATPase n=1 Tax=Yoonia rosea TaxID=287098 RepID=A0A1R3XGX6_9RHOB|nr:ATP12 family protein [Yoonia rosea]SIT90115.1 Chaperone required for the assembly of the F1-ATPase [Yoonia rosea]
MSDWQPKRFWKQAQAEVCEGGFTVLLDGRPVRTPAKAPLAVPTHAMADAIAKEWDAQEKVIDPRTMPVTRGANAAIDKVRTQREEVIAMLAEYGDSDLLCYRAAGPEGLIQKQADAWDPMLDWAADALGVRLAVGEGVMHVAQNPEALGKLRDELAVFDEFALAAVHDLISLSGSLILALGVTREVIAVERAWLLSRVDEHWQIAQWGEDEEATAAEAIKRRAFEDAARFYRFSLT